MASTVWCGPLVCLRAPAMTDLSVFLHEAAEHLDDTRLYGDHVPIPTSADHHRAWLEREVQRTGAENRMLLITHGERVVGTISTFRCDPRAGVFWIAMHVFAEHRRRGYASEAVRILLRAHFDELRYEKAQAMVHDHNEPSILLHRRLGFVEEGRLRQASYSAGRRGDDLVFGITAAEFRQRWG